MKVMIEMEEADFMRYVKFRNMAFSDKSYMIGKISDLIDKINLKMQDAPSSDEMSLCMEVDFHLKAYQSICEELGGRSQYV